MTAAPMRQCESAEFEELSLESLEEVRGGNLLLLFIGACAIAAALAIASKAEAPRPIEPPAPPQPIPAGGGGWWYPIDHPM
jgi:hypothetical protein